jgi:hypothetical protein
LATSDTELTAIICEHETGTISCPEATDKLDIIDANWGRTQPGSVACPGSSPVDVTDCYYDSTNVIVSQCSDRNNCSVRASNEAMGKDPCAYVVKYLNVTYRCGKYVTIHC